MGDDDGCCGGDQNDDGVGGCGKCLLVQNPDSVNPEWTAVVMKTSRCPPETNGCAHGSVHMDFAVPGHDNLKYSTAAVCGSETRRETYIDAKAATVCGDWSVPCNCSKIPADTAATAMLRSGCELFTEWGWTNGNPHLDYKMVPCPAAFMERVSSAFGRDGVLPGNGGIL